MSWSIANVVNSVRISKKCAKEIFDAQGYEGEIWNDLADVTHNGKLTFNEDHSEHMDYFGSNDKVLAICLKHRVSGDICFGSLEGDNAGSFWGYRFDGRGGFINLNGRLIWEKTNPRIEGKTIVFTGTLESMTRDEAKASVEHAGGKCASTVSKNVDYLVVGNKPGLKLSRAQSLEVETISEHQFMDLLFR